jgi:ABC-type sugar transport system substrate-binding protein
MRRTLTTAVLALALAASAVPGMAKAKKSKHSPEHIAAVKKCQDDYKAAVADAKTKKGKERSDALKAASKSRKDCIAAAPK